MSEFLRKTGGIIQQTTPHPKGLAKAIVSRCSAQAFLIRHISRAKISEYLTLTSSSFSKYFDKVSGGFLIFAAILLGLKDVETQIKT